MRDAATKALKSDHTWSSFFSTTFSGILTGLTLPLGHALLRYIYTSWTGSEASLNPEVIKKLNKLMTNGFTQFQAKKFHQSLKSFQLAKQYINQHLKKDLENNSRLQQLYIEIVYNICLNLTSIDECSVALISLNKLQQQLSSWRTSSFDIDIYNLKAVIYLKKNEAKEAQGVFKQSLEVDPYQTEIQMLEIYSQVNESKEDKSDDEHVRRQCLQVISMGLNLKLVNPIYFELNMAYLKALYICGRHLECSKNLQQLEEKYKCPTFSTRDREKLYQLALDNLQKLYDSPDPESKQPELKREIEIYQAKGQFPRPTPVKISLSNQKPSISGEDFENRLTNNEISVFKESRLWFIYYYKNDNQLHNHKIPGEEILKIFKLKNFDELNLDDNNQFSLTNSQQRRLYRKLVQFHNSNKVFPQQSIFKTVEWAKARDVGLVFGLGLGIGLATPAIKRASGFSR